MRIYTCSEARQKLATLLDEAESTGRVIIKRKDGRIFSLVPDPASKSPLDIPSIKTDITTKEIIGIIRKGRQRTKLPKALR